MKTTNLVTKNLIYLLFLFLAGMVTLSACGEAEETPAPVAPEDVKANATDTTIRFLYTSDTESEFLPFETKYKINGERQKIKVAGYTGLLSLLKQKRAENVPNITISGGDDPLGRFFNYFKGSATVDLIEKMGYEVSIPGNHEFDKGETEYAKALENTDNDVLCANMEFKNEYLAKRIKPSVIKEIGGVKVGFFGLLTPTISFVSSVDKDSVVKTDLVAVSKKQIEELKAQGAEIIVAINHIGQPEDVKLATQVSGIHVIFGAHSHKYTEKPVYVTREDGWKTIVVNGGQKGVYLCKLDLTINKTGKDAKITKDNWELIPNFGEVESDKELQKTVDEYVAKMPAEVVVAKTDVLLNGAEIRFKESNLGNLICDTLLERFQKETDLCIYNSGGIRISIQPGNVTSTMLENLMPFGNTATIVTIKGKELKGIFERSAASYETGAFLQFSKNIKVVYNMSKDPQVIDLETIKVSQKGNRVESLLIDGKEVELEKDYRILTNSFVADGGDGYIMLKDCPHTNTYAVVQEIIRECFEKAGNVTAKIDGRLTIK